MATDFLSNRTYNVNVTEYEEMILDCEYSILTVAQNDSPGSYISWLKDGFKVAEPVKLANIDLKDAKLSKDNQF